MTRNWYTTPSVSVDLDGTLAPDGRSEQPGEPFPHMVGLLHTWHRLGYLVVVNTSRPAAHHDVVQAWLQENELPVDQVVYGRANADAQVDDRGLLLPPHALEEWVTLRLSDQPAPAQWTQGPVVTRFREDVANCQENPDASGHDSRVGLLVVVPLTGGLDSATAHAMATALDLPVRSVYVNAGQPYAAAEIDAARRFDPDLVVLDAPLHFAHQYEHILVGRNAAFLWLAAEQLRAEAEYGEIWLGNHGDETKARVGDKSVRFHTTMQHLLTAYGFDVHLCHPLQGMTKTDLVRWWATRDRLPEALATRTCFTATGDGGHCGHCWACLQRVLAFGCAGHLDAVMATMPACDFSTPAAALYAKAHQRRKRGQPAGRDPAAFGVLAELGYSDDSEGRLR